MLQYKLYGLAHDLRKSISTNIIQSATESKTIVNAIYKRDALSFASETYHDFN